MKLFLLLQLVFSQSAIPLAFIGYRDAFIIVVVVILTHVWSLGFTLRVSHHIYSSTSVVSVCVSGMHQTLGEIASQIAVGQGEKKRIF